MAMTPSRRELVHGGFGYGSAWIGEEQVIAVPDWQEARYGDYEVRRLKPRRRRLQQRLLERCWRPHLSR